MLSSLNKDIIIDRYTFTSTSMVFDLYSWIGNSQSFLYHNFYMLTSAVHVFVVVVVLFQVCANGIEILSCILMTILKNLRTWCGK